MRSGCVLMPVPQTTKRCPHLKLHKERRCDPTHQFTSQVPAWLRGPHTRDSQHCKCELTLTVSAASSPNRRSTWSRRCSRRRFRAWCDRRCDAVPVRHEQRRCDPTSSTPALRPCGSEGATPRRHVFPAAHSLRRADRSFLPLPGSPRRKDFGPGDRRRDPTAHSHS